MTKIAGGPIPLGRPSFRPPWIDEVRRHTDGFLERFFVERAEADQSRGAEASLLRTAIAELTMRGGKRLRPAVLVAAYRAVAPDAIWTATLPICAGLELLQTYLLIHDDWMDDDVERRGGPSVHIALAERTGDPALGARLAVLAGDLASAWAWDLVLDGAWSSPHGRDALAAFSRLHHEVVLGQEMDLRGSDVHLDVARMQRLKTGSYTVDGPVRLGAILAGARAPELAALEAFAAPLGEAFQVRDDLLGTFGDPAVTGKPVGSDLCAGRRNALVRAADELLAPADREALDAVLGRPEATARERERVIAIFDRAGVRDAVETHLRTLLDLAVAALDGAPLHEPGVQMLRDLASALALRDR